MAFVTLREIMEETKDKEPIVEEKTDTLKDKIFPKKKSEGRLSKKIKRLEQTISTIQSDLKIIKSRLGL